MTARLPVSVTDGENADFIPRQIRVQIAFSLFIGCAVFEWGFVTQCRVARMKVKKKKSFFHTACFFFTHSLIMFVI